MRRRRNAEIRKDGTVPSLDAQGFARQQFAVQALSNAMYAYTFGIVGDFDGSEGRGLGTGVGILWKDTHLILTAAHTLKDTPAHRLYFLPPAPTLEVADSFADADRNKALVFKRGQFLTQRILISTYQDLAAVVVPSQSEETTQKHFYDFNGKAPVARLGSIVCFLGYPISLSKRVGGNYAVFPFSDSGEVCEADVQYDAKTQLLVRYHLGTDVDPHGLSGSGIWRFKNSDQVWAARLSLGGLITKYYPKSRVLAGYRSATLRRFLRDNEAQMRARRSV